MEQWDSLFLKHFSRSHLSKSSHFYQDISCVLLGLKPAHLVDYLPSKPQKLKLFLEEVKQSCNALWDNSKLCILLLGEDVLFVNRNSLHPSRNRPVFINVSKSLDKPEILSTEKALRIAEKPFLSCCEVLDRTLLDSRDNHVPIVEYYSPHGHHPTSSNGVGPTAEADEENLCCLFGWLLGYPAVYWFDAKEGYSLDMEELIRHSVLVRRGGTKKETKVGVYH